MGIWAIGDVQGCLEPLKALIAKVQAQDATAIFWLCGDLVNRGPDSLGTLQYLQALQMQGVQVRTVLGNHDLFALACAAGFMRPKSHDTLDALLAQPESWVNWLRIQPLLIHEGGFLLSHAGVWPAWDAAQAAQLAASVEAVLRADDWAAQLQKLWRGATRHWRNDLNTLDAQRFTINALLRMRFIAPDGGLDFDVKESAGNAPAGYTPWFECAQKAADDAVVVFGHWSALGLLNRPRIIALDTGCVWGRQLTAMKLHVDMAQRVVLQVDAT